ncbi:MAG: glutamate--tRNA ligase [Syntrophomonadaceae bacterium]
MKVRVRFAPSPTGTLHIGGARTALFNWLYARGNGGSFILRIEDTDLSRSTEASAQGIIEGLNWLGLDWDEGPDIGGPYGPYRQSQRLPVYKEYLSQLVESGKAYYCFCSPDELEQERQKAQEEKRDYHYSGKCVNLTPEQVAERLQAGQKPVIRLKVPSQGKTVVNDLIRGQVAFNNSLMDDFIIAKSDGWPTYNFAVVIDDHTMKITHVIRAEEHLSNTPKQLLIYQALDLTPPEFAHVSMILSPERSKLSKRHGATSVQEFRDEGYLPEALLNYLALMGWSTGEDQDFWTKEQMIKSFKLENVSRSPAVYDKDKLTWLNGHYLAQADLNRIVKLLEPEATKRGWYNKDHPDYFKMVINLVRSREKTSNGILDACGYFFEDIAAYDEKGVNKYFLNENSFEVLNRVKTLVENCEGFTADLLERQIRQEADKMGLNAANLIHPVRLALTGRTSTPGLFEVMELLGRERCINRLHNALLFIQNHR